MMLGWGTFISVHQPRFGRSLEIALNADALIGAS